MGIGRYAIDSHSITTQKLQEVKEKFPEAVGEIETLESLGFTSRSDGWIDRLNSEKAQIACWLMGHIDGDRDADLLINILSSQRSELWMQAATSLSLIATESHVKPLLSVLATSSHPDQRNSVVYALSFLNYGEINQQVITTLRDHL